MWISLCVFGIAFVVLEIFIPSMFFLNFAVAAFVTAAASYFTHDILILAVIFFILSFLSFIFLRPMILRRYKKGTETGIAGKYIGKIARVIEEVSDTKGVITIYDERWEARCENGAEIIPLESEVEIVRNDGLTMFVKKTGGI